MASGTAAAHRFTVSGCSDRAKMQGRSFFYSRTLQVQTITSSQHKLVCQLLVVCSCILLLHPKAFLFLKPGKTFLLNAKEARLFLQQKAASTNNKQLTKQMLVCELFVVCACILLLKAATFSHVFRCMQRCRNDISWILSRGSVPRICGLQRELCFIGSFQL